MTQTTQNEAQKKEPLDERELTIEEIPKEFIIPNEIVVSKETFEKILDMIENPPEPTEDLIKMMKATTL